MQVLFLTECRRPVPPEISDVVAECDVRLAATDSIKHAIHTVADGDVDLLFLDADDVSPEEATVLLLSEVPVVICCSADKHEGIRRLYRDISDGVIVKDLPESYPAVAAAIRHYYFQSPRLLKSRLKGISVNGH